MEKIYIEDNYLFYINKEGVIASEHTSAVFFLPTSAALDEYKMISPKLGNNVIVVANTTDKAGAAYTPASFETFYKKNTGFNPATGGSVAGALRVVGFWDASTNTPNLSSLTLTQGEAYQVSVSGSTSLNGETNWASKDLAVWSDGLAGNWFKINNTDDVLSVNGKTGVVVLSSVDIADFNAAVSSNSNVVANTAKAGITPTQAADITANNAKVSFIDAPSDGKRYVRKNNSWIEDVLDNVTNSEMLALVSPSIGEKVINTTWGQVYTFDGDVWLTANLVKAINENAAAVVEGNTVIQDGTVENGINMTSTSNSIAIIGVIKDIYSGGVNGSFVTVAIAGEHNVLCAGTITKGEALVQDNNNGEAQGTNFGATGIFAISRGSKGFGVALIKAWIQPTERF